MKTSHESPEPPAGLSPKSEALWLSVADRARSPGRQALLAEALRALDRADQARTAVDAEGLTLTTPRSGVSHVNPLLLAEERFRRQFSAAWVALGLQSAGPDVELEAMLRGAR